MLSPILALVCAYGLFFCAAAAHATAESDYQAGLTYIEDTRNIDIAQALTWFHSALTQDPTHGPANIFAAILELAQVADDTTIYALRRSFSNNVDSATVSQYLSRVNKGEKFDSMVDYRKYSWGTDPRASTVQSILTRVITDSIPHIESHLIAAEDTNAVFALPGKLIDDSPKSDTYEIDKTEILLMHSALLYFKAVLTFLTAYNLDVTDTPEYVDDTISIDSFHANHRSLLTANSTLSSVWSTLAQVDTKLYDASVAIRNETDSATQDTDLLRLTSIDTWNDRYVTDTDITKFLSWHNDTLVDFQRGDSYEIEPHKGNGDLDSVWIVPKAVFDSNIDRTDLADLRVGPLGRGPEWNSGDDWIDPTFGGIFPRMTLDNLFLHVFQPDTYFVIASSSTIDLNSLFTYRIPEIIDLHFTGAQPVTFQRRNNSTSNRLWKLTITPATSNFHVRLLFDVFDKDDFESWETFKIARPGDATGPFLRVVPWRSTGGFASDAGSSYGTFSSYFSSFSLSNSFLNYDDDSVAMFVMPNGAFQFDTIDATALPDTTGDSTLVTGSATQLGWFITGWPATPADSVFIYSYTNFLTGETSTKLTSDFSVQVVRLKTYSDTKFGYFIDYSGSFSPVSGVPVTFSVHDYPSGAAGQDIDTKSTTTNSSGFAYTRLTLGDKPGIYTVKATISADSGGGVAFLYGATEGITFWPGGDWRMFSLPRQPSSLTTSSIMSGSTFSSSEWRFYEYSPTSDTYTQPSSLKMGRGYWLKTLSNGIIKIDPSTSSALTDTQYIALDAGWNMIGNPFQKVYKSSQLSVQTSAGNVVSLDTAEDSGILYHKFYVYEGNYSYYGPDATLGTNPWYLYPFEGQWIRAIQACTLVIPPPSSVGTFTGGPILSASSYRSPNHSSPYTPKLLATAPLAPKHMDNWTLQLIAESGKSADMMNVVGVRPKATAPVFKAPRPPGGVHVAIRRGGAAYASDYVTPQEDIEWQLEVFSGAAGSVTLRVANIGSVPTDVPLTLTDLVTGDQTDLREQSFYTYSAAAGEARAFSLATEEANFLKKKIKMPEMMCVITRAFGSDSALSNALRSLRDRLMATSLGRRITQSYYGVCP